MAALKFDPTTLPIAAVSDEPAVDPLLLTPQRLRDSFLTPLPWRPEVNADPRLSPAAAPFTAAAVLIPVVTHLSGMTVLLTLRTSHLNDHAGQIAFPGGRAEDFDTSPAETALRETEEEIGLSREHIEIIGHLPEYFTGTGYRVTPVVGLVQPPFKLNPDANEVAEVFEVPLAFLLDPSNHQTRRIQLEQTLRTFYTMPYERHFIWGATAGMLRNLYRFLAPQLDVSGQRS